MATKKDNDFNQEIYAQKVDSAHDKLKTLESRIKHIENITDSSLIYKTIKKDYELRLEIERLIWKTIVGKALLGFFWILGAVIIIPILSKMLNFILIKIGL